MFDENYSQAIASGMNKIVNSFEHKKLFKKPLIKEAGLDKEAKHCCDCKKCNSTCKCKKDCSKDCPACGNKESVANQIWLDVMKLSELMDHYKLNKTAQALLDAVEDFDSEDLPETDLEITPAEEQAIESALRDLEMDEPNENELSDLEDLNPDLQDDLIHDYKPRMKDLGEHSINLEAAKYPNKKIAKVFNELDKWINKNAEEEESSFLENSMQGYKRPNDNQLKEIKKYRSSEEKFEMIEAGRVMGNYHAGQGDPVYMVGSLFRQGEDYPDLEIVEQAKNFLEKDSEKLSNDLTEEEQEELFNTIDFLDKYLEKHDSSSEIEPWAYDKNAVPIKEKYDYEPCPECGLDHSYEYEEAQKAHKKANLKQKLTKTSNEDFNVNANDNNFWKKYKNPIKRKELAADQILDNLQSILDSDSVFEEEETFYPAPRDRRLDELYEAAEAAGMNMQEAIDYARSKLLDDESSIS